MPKNKEAIQIVHLDHRNFINRFQIFDKNPQAVFDYIAEGLIDDKTFKIEIKRITQKGNAIPKTQNVTAKQTNKLTSTKRKIHK